MRCIVCGSELFDEQNCECPACGFESPVVAGTAEQGVIDELLKKYADRYRMVRRNGIVVGIKVFSYWKDRNGTLEEDREMVIPLSPKENNGEYGSIQWNDMRFAPAPPGQKMRLCIIVKDGSDKETERLVSMTTPNWGETPWKIGFLETEKLCFRIVLGTDSDGNRMLESEPVSMVYA